MKSLLSVKIAGKEHGPCKYEWESEDKETIFGSFEIGNEYDMEFDEVGLRKMIYIGMTEVVFVRAHAFSCILPNGDVFSHVIYEKPCKTNEATES